MKLACRPLFMNPHVYLAGIVLCASGAQAQILSSGQPNTAFPSFHAWFDAADGVNGPGQPLDGATVVSWLDRSGGGHDLVQVDPDPQQRPAFSAGAAGDPPSVVFDGNDYIWGDGGGEFGTLAGSKTVFVAVEVELADGGYVFDGTTAGGRNAVLTGQSSSPNRWNLYSGHNPITTGPTVTTGLVQVHSFVLAPGANAHFLNGELVASGSSALAPLEGLILGSRYTLSNRLLGRISELLVYAEALADPERAQLEGYLFTKYPPTDPPLRPEFVDVFDGGVGYPAYRIPSVLVTRAGTVLALAEGRQSISDHAQNDIVLRRSSDGGASFGPLVTLADDGGNSLNNPCALEVRDGQHAGRIYVMYQRYPQGCHESCVVAGWSGPNICRSFLMHSDDDGVTWSTPLDVTTQVKRPTVATSIAGGPGIGIQKRRDPHAGRLIFPFNQGPGPSWKVYAAFSDDGGETWAWGDVADDTQSAGVGNEVQMVELSDGSLMLNARSSGGTQHRKVAWSTDGGDSWSPLLDELELVEPQVMASVLRYTDTLDGHHAARLLYAGPDSQSARVDGTVRISYDEGQSWPVARLLHPGFYAYSVLTSFDNGDIGVLFEREGYDRITLARFPVEWLSDGLDCVGTIRQSCPATPNSQGMGAELTLTGGNSLAANQTVLGMTAGPPAQPALFFYGASAAPTAFGNGQLCAAAPFLRLGPPQTLDLAGSTGRPLDYTQPPLSASPGAATVGVPLSFQVWYRDPAAGGAGFDLSSALEVVFCP